MKYFVGFLFSLLTVVASAEIIKRRNSVAISYTLNLSFDKDRQKITARFYNKSAMDLQIQKNSDSSSFFAGRIKLFAFQDNEDLSRLPSYFSIDSDPDLISIRTNEYFEKEIRLEDSGKNYCDILNKNPILIFWSYSYHDDRYTLFPEVGVFRIKRSDMDCKIK